MNEGDIGIGSVVLSRKGRDKGDYLMVVSKAHGVVFLADGGARKLSSPKRKNVKHVSDSGIKLNAIAAKLKEGQKVFDSELKSALRQLKIGKGDQK
mgnify:CR=1 FL=1